MKFSTPFCSADILLPKVGDLTRWSVVACDQYTSEPEYWERADAFVGSAPSALRLILPELYLGREDTGERIADIRAHLSAYLKGGVFAEFKDSMIYVERTQSDGRIRRGIVGAIDLESYDYRPGSRTEVRATEATVVERIPPRLEIRRAADIELPHIMMLIDDPQDTVIGSLIGKPIKPLYDFELMLGGGRLKGSLIGSEGIAAVDSALAALKERSGGMLFATGDGNHSLATAKEHYEQLKRENPGRDMSNHPARWALCEIVNLHSPALEFEAIHRLLRVDDPYKFIMEMSMELELSGVPSAQRVRIHRNYSVRVLCIHHPLSKLSVGSIQAFIDNYIAENGGSVDYIHGGEALRRLAQEDGVIGFEFEPIKKEELFPAVIADGALPRKTFSMGSAADKRYYMEARRITD